MNQNTCHRLLTVLLPLAACVFVSAAFADGLSDAGSAIPSGYSTTLTGSVHDFDYFMGSGWITHQHRMKATADSMQDAGEFEGHLCALPYLDGTATVDELYFPSKGTAGLTLRLFNPKTHQWSIYWVSSTDNVLDANPVVGGFKGNRGLFYGIDTDARGRPIKVRFIWTFIDHDHARWEQAIAHKDGVWVTNWTADFIRADRNKVCTTSGLPKR